MTTSEAIGHVVRIRRAELGLSQRQLAFRMKMSAKQRTWISKVEHGITTPTFATFERLANALESTGSALLALAEDYAVGVVRGIVEVPVATTGRPLKVERSPAIPDSVGNPKSVARRREIARKLGTLPVETSV